VPWNATNKVFVRIWKFVDAFSTSDKINRTDLDASLDDIADGIEQLYQDLSGGGVVQDYLGLAAADPTAGVGGAALAAGNWYIRTPDYYIRTYTGSTWQTVSRVPNATAFFRQLSAAADQGQARALLGLAIGSQVQAYNALLANIANLGDPGSNQVLGWNASTNGLGYLGAPSTGIPSGVVAMWSGSIANIPAGWLLCDGTNGTPDLTGRFVVHADADSGGTYAPDDTGGANSVTLTTSQIPSHTHDFSGTTGAETIGEVTGTGDVVTLPAEAPRATGAANNQSHTHSFSGTTDAAGSGGSHENRPPYYALAYIMKS
jgi:hypothetical protein